MLCIKSYSVNSLTATLDQLRVIAISTERSRLWNWQALIDKLVSSLHARAKCGWPVGHFQPAAGGTSVKASIDRCSACEAGVFLGSRHMWPKVESDICQWWEKADLAALLSPWLRHWWSCHTFSHSLKVCHILQMVVKIPPIHHTKTASILTCEVLLLKLVCHVCWSTDLLKDKLNRQLSYRVDLWCDRHQQLWKSTTRSTCHYWPPWCAGSRPYTVKVEHRHCV